MDEFQFIESLDALLASEAIDETTTAAVELANTSISPVHGQGILSGPTGPGQVVETTNTGWLGRNDTTISTSDPFMMPELTTVTATPSVEAKPFSQYSGVYIEQQPTTEKSALSSSASAGRIILSTLGAKPSTATNAAVATQSTVASVCSVNSRGSSNASSSKRRSSGKNNNGGTSVGSNSSPGTKVASRKRARGGTSMAVSDSEDECSRRRHDRNLREQRRSQKITHQIDQLREVLAAASVRFKPDKYSTLVSVVEYVKQLQRRSTMLDMEHKKLLDTISRTNEMVNEPYLANAGASTSSTTARSRNKIGGLGIDSVNPDSALSGVVGDNHSTNGVANVGSGDIYNDDELVFVRNVDYKCIFDRCGMPLAVASIDGRLMDCNCEFVKLTGYRREELLPNEQHLKQQRQKVLQQQGSAIIADDIGSSYLSGSVFPEPTTSSSDNRGGNVTIKEESGACNAVGTAPDSRVTNTTTRNFSLFNLLSRNDMEEVFVSLSDMLKQPPKDDIGIESVSNADYWSGNVRLSRNTHLEMRINVSLVRSPQGRAKFFDCSLTPLSPLPV